MASQRRRVRWRRRVLLLGVMLLVPIAFAPSDVGGATYMNAETLGKRLREIRRVHGKLVRVSSLAQSLGKREVWLVEIGAGSDQERRSRPAMLVVAGIEGNDLAGCAVAVAWIEQLAGRYEKNADVRRLLDTTTVYVIPRLNADAAETFFAKPLLETAVSTKPFDDDHDGMIDEDGPEDLDSDGRIAWMRIQDPEGEYILDPVEPRLLMKADPIKGEVGAWRLMSEGRDNDADEKWNEDGPGGVNFNRNFPSQYQWFAPWSGVHQVSEVETRALADFVIAHPNIGIVFTFGEADNLVQTPKAAPPAERGKPPTAINEKDLPYYQELGEIYRKTLALKKELKGSSSPGSFSDWMYFHRGRLSLAAQVWNPPLQIELTKPKETKQTETKTEDKTATPTSSGNPRPPARPAAEKEAAEKKEDAAKRNEEDRAFLKWLDKNAPDLFVPWREFKHPDFPGKRVEIGGFAPFARIAPPEPILNEVTTKHCDFLTTLALRLPRVAVRKMESKHLGNSVYEVEIQVENTGYLPTVLEHGGITGEIDPTRVVVDLLDKAFLSGTKTARLPTLAGSGGMREVRYILHVPGGKQVKVAVVSALGGTVQTTLQLSEDKSR